MEWPDWIDVKADGYAPFKTDLYYNLKNNKIIVLYNAVDYKAGEMSSIVLPITPDKELGRYFRYDRIEEKRDLVFEREFNPQPNTPYIFIPYQDVHIDLTGMDFSAEINNIEDTYGVSFIGSYSSIAPLLMDNYEYWSIGNDGADTYNEMSDRDTVFCLPKAMHATLLLNFAYLRANNQLINNGFPEIVLHDPDENYHPFVAKWKQWHVLGFSVGPYKSVTDYFFTDEEETIGEHTYLKLFTGDWDYALAGVSDENKQLQGLFREENRRVYLYDKDTEQEYCVYDFTLEVGDTFDIGIGPEADRRVVTNVDYMTVNDTELRTITLQSVNPQNGGKNKWVEGIGSLGMPTDGWNPDLGAPSSWSYALAYVDSYYGSRYYPFSFWNIWGDNNFVFGQDLVRGKEMPYESALGGDKLKCEIVDEKLHVTGTMWMQCGPNNYIFCRISPNNSKYEVSFSTYGVNPQIDRRAPYAVDLYFNLPYYLVRDVESFVYIDSEGEHPIPIRNEYHPFIEEGKVWKTGQISRLSTLANEVRYYYFDGDSIVGGQSCKKMMQCTENTEMRKTELVALLYEQEKRVYNWNDNRGFACLYDFAADIDEEIVFNNPIFWGTYQFIVCKIIAKEHQEKAEYTGNVIQLEVNPIIDVGAKEDRGLCTSNGTTTITWLTGVGGLSNPLRSIYSIFFNEESDEGEWLISCYTAIDTLFQSSKYTDAVSEYWDEDNETKKQKIDFTHVIKTKPTSPQPVSTNISLLWGEYSNAVLNIDFEGMNGRYKINVRKDGEHQDRFSANQETHNLQSLDVNLAGYPDGDYTVVVENDGESYTAHFALPLDGTGIESIQNSKFKIDNNAPVYDLSGRRVSASSAPKGIYVQGNKKIVKQ